MSAKNLTTAASRPSRLLMAHEAKLHRHRLKPLLIATRHSADHTSHCSMPSESSPSRFFWKELKVPCKPMYSTVQYLRMQCNARASEPYYSHVQFGKVDALVPLVSSSYTPSELPSRRHLHFAFLIEATLRPTCASLNDHGFRPVRSGRRVSAVINSGMRQIEESHDERCAT